MLSNLLIEDLQKGYDASCKELQDLIIYRLNTRGAEIFKDLFDTQRHLVDEYCAENDLDLALVAMQKDKTTQVNIGLEIIEAQIHQKLKEKIAKDKLIKEDTIIKELGLKCYVISNGIENAPWLKLFNSPLSLQWWTKNTSEIINNCDKEHIGYEKLVRVVNAIRDNWIKPQDVLPDIEAYNELMNFQVPEEVKDLVVK